MERCHQQDNSAWSSAWSEEFQKHAQKIEREKAEKDVNMDDASQLLTSRCMLERGKLMGCGGAD